ncbi:jg15493 [Pararge aegeria aegeria]|uniref:Jg15493 protein n=1 Tax=Pararge aegeria aegeria TaxID=348720 RepID=A0A8S4RD14_9NEOP|nr:jg15493 [Pararge aegeria aegeria]
MAHLMVRGKPLTDKDVPLSDSVFRCDVAQKPFRDMTTTLPDRLARYHLRLHHHLRPGHERNTVFQRAAPCPVRGAFTIMLLDNLSSRSRPQKPRTPSDYNSRRVFNRLHFYVLHVRTSVRLATLLASSRAGAGEIPFREFSA